MNTSSILWLSGKQLNEKRMRTALTVLMVVIGVASIVALTSQTAGVSKSIQSTLGSLGPTSIIITPAAGKTFTDADVDNLEALPNVSSVTPIVTGRATVSVDGYNTSATVIGISTNGIVNLLGSNATNLYGGTLYQDNEVPAVVIGHSVAFASTSNPDLETAAVGQTATFLISSASTGRGSSGSAKIYLPVVGILPSHSSFLIPIDTGVFISTPLAELLLHTTSFNEILVKANTAQNVTGLTTLISTVYGSTATVTDSAQFADTAASVEGQTDSLFLVIAGISLLVAAIGIMNVMLMSVSERIHDIGILKSIGFKSKHILLIFLMQAVTIGVLGGVLGLATGAVASYSIALLPSSSTTGATHAVTPSGGGTFAASGAGGAASFRTAGAGGAAAGRFAGGAGGASTFSSSASATSSTSTPIEPVFTLSVIAEALIIAISISVIAGIYPAWKASRMEPIDALRIL